MSKIHVSISQERLIGIFLPSVTWAKRMKQHTSVRLDQRINRLASVALSWLWMVKYVEQSERMWETMIYIVKWFNAFLNKCCRSGSAETFQRETESRDCVSRTRSLSDPPVFTSLQAQRKPAPVSRGNQSGDEYVLYYIHSYSSWLINVLNVREKLCVDKNMKFFAVSSTIPSYTSWQHYK